jgi:integrase
VYARSESEADRLLSAAIRDYKRGAAVADTRTTVAAYLDDWLERVVPRLKPHSRRSYEGAIRLYISPRIGGIPMGALTGTQVQTMVDSTAREHGVRAAGVAHSVLRKALADARRIDRIVERNVAADAAPPPWRRRLPTPWPIEQAAAFLVALRGHPDEALYLLAAMVGPRPSEVLALRWSRFDLDRGRMTIDAALQWPVGESPYLDTPKSAAANRTVALPPRVLVALRRHKADQDAQREKWGEGWRDKGLVFVEPLPRINGTTHLSPGRPMRADTLSHRTARLIEHLGFSHIRLYDLRRLAATLIIAAGGPEAARRTLGHSSQRLAVETYGYEIEGRSREVAAGVEALLGAGFPGDSPSDSPSSGA